MADYLLTSEDRRKLEEAMLLKQRVTLWENDGDAAKFAAARALLAGLVKVPEPQVLKIVARPLSECTEADLVSFHALVFGRVKIWHPNFTDDHELKFHWSSTVWWKAMWYSHRGAPSGSHTWGVYGGGSGYTGPGDAELTHFLPMPPLPQ